MKAALTNGGGVACVCVCVCVCGWVGGMCVSLHVHYGLAGSTVSEKQNMNMEKPFVTQHGLYTGFCIFHFVACLNTAVVEAWK